MAEFDMEAELTCSICTDILFQPLTLLNCLHTFCGGCLQEWFAWQATAAAQKRRTTNPYTCPSCRDSVKDTKADFRLAGLSEGYLKANPGRGKNEEEKEESRKHYKPGDNVLPPLPPAEEEDSEDERLMAHVRDLTMANVDPETARRRAERAARERQRRRQDARPARSGAEELRRNQQPSEFVAQRAQRQQEQDSDVREVEHQPSLRSLLSGSDLNAQAIHQEILQSMFSDGLLDGIDTDNLTAAQEDELVQRIAEAYQRRQRQRDRSRHRERRNETPASSVPQPMHRSRNTSPDRRQTRTASASTNQQQQQSRARPPISRPHLFEQTASDDSRSQPRSTSQTRSHQEGGRAHSHRQQAAPATRSVADVSPRPDAAESHGERRRSSNNRSSTDPASVRDEVCQVNHTSAATRPESDQTTPRTHSHDVAPVEAVRRLHISGPANASTSSLPIPVSEVTTPPATSVRPMQSTAAFAPELVTPDQASNAPPPPAVSCSRCSKPNIEIQLHYNCSKCHGGNFNICQSCYRNERGCNHWFGFGFMAMHRWQRAAPAEGWPTGFEYPHVFLPRRYESTPPQPQSTPATTQQDTHASLQEGAFCEMCSKSTNDCYWYCQDCLEGAWGYCNSCVLRGRHCTHPLLPLAHLSTLHTTHSDPSKLIFVPAPHLKPHSYTILPAPSLVDCDSCRLPIPPRSPRLHCYTCSDGDYDVCTDCYARFVATGKISAANGPAGWRRCPQGHRMAVVEYCDTPYRGGMVRVTVREPVGGRRLKDDGGAMQQAALPPPTDESLGARYVAVWSRFPLEADGEDLVLPKNAEVRECEEMNEDWAVGVYAGRVGVWPRNHGRRV